MHLKEEKRAERKIKAQAEICIKSEFQSLSELFRHRTFYESQ